MELFVRPDWWPRDLALLSILWIDETGRLKHARQQRVLLAILNQAIVISNESTSLILKSIVDVECFNSIDFISAILRLWKALTPIGEQGITHIHTNITLKPHIHPGYQANRLGPGLSTNSAIAETFSCRKALHNLLQRFHAPPKPNRAKPKRRTAHYIARALGLLC